MRYGHRAIVDMSTMMSATFSNWYSPWNNGVAVPLDYPLITRRRPR